MHGQRDPRHDSEVSLRSIPLLLLRWLWPALMVLAAHAQSPCRIDPFGAESAADRAAVLSRGCGGERVDYRLESLRAQPTDVGPSLVAAHVDAVATRPFGDALLGTMRLNWSGAGSEASDRLLRTERTTWAAGTWWRLDRQWAVQVNIGREFAAVARSRATLAGIWRPLRNTLLFAEWAGNADRTEGQRVGVRWWLVRNRLLLEAGAQRFADLGWADQHVQLNWGLLR